MSTFKITAATSVFTTTAGDHAFDSDTIAADSLTVDPGAFLTATGTGADGALLANTLAWTVSVNGSIFSQQAAGIELAAGNTKASSITVSADGEVGGGTFGIDAASSASIKNAGTVNGTDTGIKITNAGIHAITNTGTLSGGSFSIHDVDGLSADTVTNSGTLNGDVDLNGGNDSLINSSQINGAVALGEGINALTNTGTISGSVSAGGGNDTVTNSNEIDGGVTLGDGINKATNSGKIDGAVSGGINADTFTNSGSVTSVVTLSDGINIFTNTGTVFSYAGGADSDTVSNTKTISSTVVLGDGINKLTNSGTINAPVSGGSNADTVSNSRLHQR